MNAISESSACHWPITFNFGTIISKQLLGLQCDSIICILCLCNKLLELLSCYLNKLV